MIIDMIFQNLIDVVTPSVNISEHFQMNFVSVTLKWTAKNGISYSVNVNPETAINYTGEWSAQLSVLYNTKYNVSVVASLCGTSQAVNSMTINYGKLQKIHQTANFTTALLLQ